MTHATLGWTGRVLRQPWYLFWRLIERYLYQGREYTVQVPFGHRLLTPWFSADETSDFVKTLKRVRAAGPLVVSADRCYILYQFCHRSLALEGDIAECGVFTGGTAHLLSLVLSTHPHPLHLFDTFSGMPDTSVPARDYHSPGDFADTSLNQVKQRLASFPFVNFHPGLIPNTFSEVVHISTYSFVHVDVDIYPSVFDCCKWFWPRLTRGGWDCL